jgi:hypothetical protein
MTIYQKAKDAKFAIEFALMMVACGREEMRWRPSGLPMRRGQFLGRDHRGRREGGCDMKQFDLFDQDAAKAGVGERQTDLESLLALVQAKDEKKQAEWIARAKAGEVMRIM